MTPLKDLIHQPLAAGRPYWYYEQVMGARPSVSRRGPDTCTPPSYHKDFTSDSEIVMVVSEKIAFLISAQGGRRWRKAAAGKMQIALG